MTTKTFIQKICCRYVVLNLIAMAVICTALVYAAMFCADIYTHHGEAIAVPDIRNKKFADAERLLEDAGLVLVVNDTSYNRLLPPDCILQQTPAPGMEVKSGRTVYVTVNSANKPTLVIPDIIDNSSMREAMAKLKILGFKVGAPEYIPGEKDWVYGIKCRGRLLSTGDKVPIDAMVVLQVGNGTIGDIDDLEIIDKSMLEEDIPEDAPEEDPFEEVTEEQAAGHGTEARL